MDPYLIHRIVLYGGSREAKILLNIDRRYFNLVHTNFDLFNQLYLTFGRKNWQTDDVRILKINELNKIKITPEDVDYVAGKDLKRFKHLFCWSHLCKGAQMRIPRMFTFKSIFQAGIRGDITLLKWLKRKTEGCCWIFLYFYIDDIKWKDYLSLIAANGHVEVLRFIQSEQLFYNIKIPLSGLKLAVQNGHLEMVELLYSKTYIGLNDHSYMVKTAAIYGHLEILQFLLNQRPWIGNIILDLAVQNGHLKMVEWFIDQNQGKMIKLKKFKYATQLLTKFEVWCSIIRPPLLKLLAS